MTTEEDKKAPTFECYSSLERINNNPNWEAFKTALFSVPGNTELTWVATEKIDGANISFQLFKRPDGTVNIQAFSRTQPLDDNTSFNGFKQVLEKYKKAFIAVFEKVTSTHPGVESVAIFGEIYGGSYPLKNALNPQSRTVLYCDKKEFNSFDILVTSGDGTTSYLDFTEHASVCKEAGVPTAPLIVAPGTFDNAMAFDVETFASRVHEQYGLPAIPNNLAEGVIIRPTKEVIFKYRGNDFRAVFKNKRAIFLEEQKQSKKPAAVPSQDAQGLIAVCKELAQSLVNESRLHNVVSHFPAFTNKQMVYSKLVPAFVDDVLKDMKKDLSETDAPKLDSPDIKKEVAKALKQSILDLVNKHVDSILEGTFV